MKNELATIWKYLRPFKRRIYFLSFLSLITAGIAAVIPLIYGQLVDHALNNKPLTLIAWGLLGWFTISMIENIIIRFVFFKKNMLAVDIEAQTVLGFIKQFIHLPFSYLKNQKTGSKLREIDMAAGHLFRIIEDIAFYFIPDTITVIFILIILSQFHWGLSIGMLVVLILYASITLLFNKKLIKGSKGIHKSYRGAYGDIYSYVNDYRTLRAFSAEEMALKDLEKGYGKIYKAFKFNYLNWMWLQGIQRVIFSSGFVLLFGFGILLMSKNQISPGNLVTFVGYISFIFGAFMRLAQYFSRISQAMVYVTKADKLYKIKTEAELRPHAIKPITSIEGRIEFKNVSFQYEENKKSTLRGVNFVVSPGEVIALVGESGAGKSTLVDLAAGYYLPSKGSVSIDKLKTSEMSGVELRKHMALVPQEVSLFHQSISANIKFGKTNATQKEVEAAAKAANAHEFILGLPKGYKSKVGERGVKLSVGQKQRIAIARAIIRDPRILILDEATSALDSVTENKVQAALKQLVKGRTTFVIAHRLSTVTDADRIFVVGDGQIAEMGNHKELIKKNGAYKKLYQAQKF